MTAPAPMVQLTQQYAVPIHQSMYLGARGQHHMGDAEQSPRVENSLRRKTPHGTLNAGYDASADDVQPQKHQLLPLQNGAVARVQQATAGPSKRTFLQHQQHQRQNNAAAWSSPSGPAWPPLQFQHAQPSFPVMDSMLHQIPAQQVSAQHFFQTVPSVIQPSLQYLGPTASGGQGTGPYGPYWHDGTYVPYRPAALRDPRYYHHPGDSWSRSLPNAQATQQMRSVPHQAQHLSYAQVAAHENKLSFFNQSPTEYTVSLRDPPPSYLASQCDITPLASLHHLYDPSTVEPQIAQASKLSHSIDVELEYGPASSNGRQREQVFAWALQQYRDLLSFVQHTRRQNAPSRHSSRSNAAHRPIFYPKPPVVSSSVSSLRPQTRRAQSDGHLLNFDIAKRSSLVHSDTSPSSNITGKPPSSWSPSGAHSQNNDLELHPSYKHDIQTQQWSTLLKDNNEKFRTLRRSSGPSTTPIITEPSIDNSPTARAAAALAQITQLCQQSDWAWTDGMHLGGCLAYGLGSYHKALRWYNKVLEMDPGHLEATSNLAATLLALGRRREAEAHWRDVIESAPSHFEAVEHLVGLLCNEQRSRDAIKVIEHVEQALRNVKPGKDLLKVSDPYSEGSSSTASRSPCQSELSDIISYDYDVEGDNHPGEGRNNLAVSEPGPSSNVFAIPRSDNGRMLALIHAKGNMLYGLGDNSGAAHAFEDAVMIAAGRRWNGIQGLVSHILSVVSSQLHQRADRQGQQQGLSAEPILLTPDQAIMTAKLCFPYSGELPGLQHVAGGPQSLARKAVISTTSNSLLSLAKIYQDGMANSARSTGIIPPVCGVRDILALYYLSLSLQPSPSTANNVGILLASVQQTVSSTQRYGKPEIPGVIPGSGIALALQYYNYGLQLDQHHAHLYTNLGSLLKDIGQLDAAINMYERAVKCDGKFDIALANLANAVKDKGRISDAIVYYKRAVEVSPDFAEAVCGLANALNSVCNWQSRGGIATDGGRRDRWHVDATGMMLDARMPGTLSSGWIKRVVDIVEKQLTDGENWGLGALTAGLLQEVIGPTSLLDGPPEEVKGREERLRKTFAQWSNQKWEGARTARLIERATRRLTWQWYHDLYVKKKQRAPACYYRPKLPAALTVPSAPTVLPFHTFTCPMSAAQIRLISQRNGLRISVSTLRAPWLPKQVFPPPPPPAPTLRVGYVSSDFNNHPLAHLMQSVFGLHDTRRVKAYCYATTASDNSVHRHQIEAEAPIFHDASSWSAEKLVDRIVQDKIHILVNLNGYTRGARNEVFAARPAPIQMSFMGFAGTLGAEWCDYLLADETAIPPSTLRPWRSNVDIEDQIVDENNGSDNAEWVYGENIIYCRDTFFCCDHKQSAPDARERRVSWGDEQSRRWAMRKELFPHISDETIIFGNFNQLYKIDPTTFRTWLRILARIPNSILWLLRFPDLGESYLLATARQWAGTDVASRVIFTDVAPKHLHISRARICDIVLDTAECNAHTTAADVLWSGTPLLTLPRYAYKMCSRMAASILKGALPKTDAGAQGARDLIATSEDDYEEKAVALGKDLAYPPGCQGRGVGRLMDLREMLYEARWTSALFDTKRWVRDLEEAYDKAWLHWVAGKGGDIWLAASETTRHISVGQKLCHPFVSSCSPGLFFCLHCAALEGSPRPRTVYFIALGLFGFPVPFFIFCAPGLSVYLDSLAQKDTPICQAIAMPPSCGVSHRNSCVAIQRSGGSRFGLWRRVENDMLLILRRLGICDGEESTWDGR
nr:putative udp-n-acetylglucosamine--peptide n-acetylglucosaminyltransferase sec [Quercus suber]